MGLVLERGAHFQDVWSHLTKPYKFIGFGAMDVTKPYNFGAMAVTKPHQFTGFGAMAVTKPYKFVGFCRD